MPSPTGRKPTRQRLALTLSTWRATLASLRMTTPAQEKIDLSHYDLIDTFSGRDAACLIAGIDPNQQEVTDLYGSPEFARMRTIEDAMEEAHKAAEREFKDTAEYAEHMLSDPWTGRTTTEGDTIPYLPCVNMRKWFYHLKNHQESAREAAKLKGVSFARGYEKQKFLREDITQWLQAKGYKQACYFLNESPFNVPDDDVTYPYNEVWDAEFNLVTGIHNPAYYKTFKSRTYLNLYEASSIIVACDVMLRKTRFRIDKKAVLLYAKKTDVLYGNMLREAVREGVISLSPNGGSVIDDEKYWQLNVRDIRLLCHKNNLAWPIPWQEEPDQPLSTESAKLQEQVKRLQEQVKQFESQAKELEALRQENAELKAQAEELGASQDIDPRLKNTLYKMIYAMAKDCYKYDPRAPRNDATNDIYLAIADAKLSLGKDAIREHLKESAKLAS